MKPLAPPWNHRSTIAGGFLVAAAWASPPFAQANAVPGIDVKHGPLTGLVWKGREGTFPNGLNAFAMNTTACNVGTLPVPWLSTDELCGGLGCECAEMLDNHPAIGFLVVREAGGRFEQISDYSFVKHAFFALSGSACDTCTGGGDNVLGVGCSDVYTHSFNGDDYWLGPAEEIDPWLGTWDVYGSHFDRGEPDVGPPLNQNGMRSLCEDQVAALGPLGHRVIVSDADLDVPGARYFFQGYYAVRSEPVLARGDNARSHEFAPVFQGGQWETDVVPGTELEGTVLGQWEGATLAFGQNGEDDGRVWVGVRVTGPEGGLYRYELALHNRDSQRKVGALRVPVCDAATVVGAGFRDIDAEAGNDWQFRRAGSALEWASPGGGAANPLRWNSIYNFWFESDAAPLEGSVTYVPHDAGPGASEIAVGGLPLPRGLFDYELGPGCSFTVPPLLDAAGQPPQATLGNEAFALESTGNDPGAIVSGFAGLPSPFLPLGAGCTLYMSGVLGTDLFGLPIVRANPDGRALLPLPIPGLPALEGLDLQVQGLSQRGGGGPLAGSFDLSNGLLVRVGSAIPGCP